MLKLKHNLKAYMLVNKNNHADYQKIFRCFTWSSPTKIITTVQTRMIPPNTTYTRGMSYCIVKNYNLPAPKPNRPKSDWIPEQILEQKEAKQPPHPKVFDTEYLKEPKAFENTWIAMTHSLPTEALQKEKKFKVIAYEYIGKDPKTNQDQWLVGISWQAHIIDVRPELMHTTLTEFWTPKPEFIAAVKKIEEKLLKLKFEQTNDMVVASLQGIHDNNSNITSYDDDREYGPIDWVEEQKHMKKKIQHSQNHHDNTNT